MSKLFRGVHTEFVFSDYNYINSGKDVYLYSFCEYEGDEVTIDKIMSNFPGEAKIHAVKWIPEREKPICVVQIVHGMAEYMPRYNEFASFLSKNGYIVIGCDLYAHGRSAIEVEQIGEVTRYDFMMAIIQSVKKVYDEMVCRFHDMPHYLFAHSMGTFVGRIYIQKYDKDIKKLKEEMNGKIKDNEEDFICTCCTPRHCGLREAHSRGRAEINTYS